MVLLSGFLLAQTPGEYVTSRTTNPPVIDGLIDDACWKTVPFASNFHMHQPYDDRPATFQTEFAILYDDNNLYVAIKAHDPEPEKIHKQITRRDQVNSEFVAVCLDSYNDNNTCYCFFITPSGVIGDLFISKDGESNDESWNAIWWGKSTINGMGWYAEFRIPLSQLRFTDKQEQIWGLDLMRDVKRLDEESFWMEHKRNDQGFVHQFGTLRGMFDVKARKVADIYPYAVGTLDTYEAEEGNPFMDGSDMKLNGGIDGKIGLTNNFTLDFTVNPDFGQVEADPATVNLSAFETFFSERRPFFIEGNNITSFQLDVNGSNEQLFHSRRIGRSPHFWPDLNDNEYEKRPTSTDIIAAAKVTGRTENGLSIGVVEAVTQEEHSKISANGNSDSTITIEPLTNFAVAAVRQDLNEGKTQLGAIVTAVNRNLAEDHLDYLHKQAYTGGFDMRHYFKDHIWQIDARLFGSYVQGSEEAISETQQSSSHLFQRPDADWVTYDSTRTSLAGHGGSVRVGKFGGQFRTALKVNWKSPGLELNDVGFVGRTDEIQQNIWLQYRKTDPFFIFNQFYLTTYQWNNFNFGGLHQNSGLNLSLNVQFKNRMGFDWGLEYNSEYLSSTALRGGPRLRMLPMTYTWAWFGTDYTKDVTYWAFTLNGFNKDKLNYYNRLENEIDWKVSPFLNFSLYADWDREQNVFHYITDVEFNGNTRYILSKFSSQSASLQMSVNWNISPNISLEYRGRPYFMSGKFSDFKVITDGDNENYADRFDLFTDNITLTDDVYYCDEDRDLITDYTFDDPDFIYGSYQSNLVFRWEYQPGSTLFLVWSRNHEMDNGENQLNIPEHVRDLNEEIPQNVFLVKISYRLGR